MATIRFSPDEIYNAANSQNTLLTSGQPYDGVDKSYMIVAGAGISTQNPFEITLAQTGSAGHAYATPIPVSYYVNFSDNTANVRMHGGTKGDILIGGSGNDTLMGGGGDDMLVGGTGTNTIDGGSGRNTVSYADYNSLSAQTLGTGVTVNLQSGTAIDRFPTFFAPATSDTLTNIQNVIGSAYADILIGTTGNGFSGGAGDDTLRTQGTPAMMDGGAGSDTLSVTGTATLTDKNFANIEKVVAYGGANLDMSGVTSAVVGGLPAVIRSQSAAGTVATIKGTQGNDTIAGGNGDDTLNGYLGNDVITTGSGNATIVGGTNTGASDGNDVIFAGGGNLTFNDFMANFGHDVVRGAAGNIANDTFQFGDSFARSMDDLHFDASGPMSTNTVITGLGGPKGGSITLVGVSSDQAQTAHFQFLAQT